MRRFLPLALFVALLFPGPAGAYERNPSLERVVGIFAMRPVEVRCPTVGEWADFATLQLGASDPELAYGVTHLYDDWVMVRPDLCFFADNITDDSLRPEFRALAVLALVHEGYHVRRWSWRRNEGRVECQAIRHFKVGARLLGASQEQANRLYQHALVWHWGLAFPGSAYRWSGCRVP